MKHCKKAIDFSKTKTMKLNEPQLASAAKKGKVRAHANCDNVNLKLMIENFCVEGIIPLECGGCLKEGEYESPYTKKGYIQHCIFH